MSKKNADIQNTLEEYQQLLQPLTLSPTRSIGMESVDKRRDGDISKYFETGWNKNDPDYNYMNDSKSQFSPFEKYQKGLNPIQIQNDII